MTRDCGRLAAFLVLLPVACARPTAPATPSTGPGAGKTTPAEAGRVTVHVKDMSRRLNLV
jgi:hypothetical protein